MVSAASSFKPWVQRWILLFPTTKVRRAKLVKYSALVLVSMFCFYGWSEIGLDRETEKQNKKDGKAEIMLQAVEDDPGDLYHLRPEDQAKFFKEREAIYLERKKRIAKVCKSIRKGDNRELEKKLNHVNHGGMRYNAKDKVAYCAICKVASSTWTKRFLQLASPSVQKKWINRIHGEAVAVWPLPKNETVEEAFKKVKSLIIARNPFSRIVSAYYDKIVKQGWIHKEINQVRVKRKGLKNYKVNPNRMPTPEDFVIFLSEQASASGNVHWRQQAYSCPFCRVNFTVYSHMEEIQLDQAYFLLKAKIADRVEHDGHMNQKDEGVTDEGFWKGVDPVYIYEVYVQYKIDFDLFGYDAIEYFKNIGLKEKALEVGELLQNSM